MKHNYTYNFLIRYIYGETALLKKLEIENAIEENETVAREYGILKKAYDLLPGVSFYPSEKTLNNILEYSMETRFNARC